ncbi:MAG: TolC family protein [Verrucomicrobiales bacterium]|nr:TolC family protein [Verrucomicrobiales bacterium]
MKRTALFLSALTVAAGGVLGTAQAVETRPLTLEDGIQMALEKNLDIRIQRLGPQIARYSVSGSYSAYEPTLSAGASFRSTTQPGGFDEQNRPFGQAQTSTESWNAGIGGLLPTGLRYEFGTGFSDAYGSREISIDNVLLGIQQFENTSGAFRFSFSQPLLRNFWIDSARLNISLSRKSLETSELSLRNQIINTITSVEIAYYELIAARETISVAEVALRLAEQLLRENKKRVEVGVMAPLDEKEAASQVAASRANLLGAQNSYASRQNQLKSLLGDQFVAWHDVQLEPAEPLTAEPTTFSLQDSWSRGITLRPDLLQAKVDLERRNITLRYQKNQLFPQLDLTGTYAQSGSGTEFSDSLSAIYSGNYPEYSFGTVLSIPLAGNRQARTNVRISKAEIEQALLRLKQIEQNVMVQIADAIAQARTSYQQVQATKEAQEFAAEALSAEEKKLENGKSTSFQVLQLQRILTTRAYEYIRARVDYSAALARLAQVEGSTLDRNRVNLEFR